METTPDSGASRPHSQAIEGGFEPRQPFDAVAVVLTYRRPRLATQMVRHLIQKQDFAPSSVMLVINGDGGLEDQALEGAIRSTTLAKNYGPAGGFRRALQEIRSQSDAPWIYICEDDGLTRRAPSHYVGDLIARVEKYERDHAGPPIGAVVLDGRHVDRRTGVQSRHVPISADVDLEEVEWSVWHGTLLSRRVLEAGVLPDEELFFGGVDMDFFLRTRAAGFRTMMDTATHRAVGPYSLHDAKLDLGVPEMRDEPWRTYYEVRNTFLFAYRYGGFRWFLSAFMHAVHLALHSSRPHVAPIMHGVIDGLLNRSGKNPRFERTVGEVAKVAVAPRKDEP